MFTPTESEKQKFVELWLELDDPFKAGCQVWPDDIQKACFAGSQFPKQAEYLQLKHELENGDYLLSKLPTKAKLLEDIYLRMQRCRFPEDYEKLARLYAQVSGFIEKPTEKKKAPTVQASNVMKVRDFGENQSWEDYAAVQQRNLEKITNDAANAD